MTEIKVSDEGEELLARLCLDLAALTDSCVRSLPSSTQSALDVALKGGAALQVVCTLIPRPAFLGVLSGPGRDPVPLFAIEPGHDTLRLLALKPETAAH